MYVTYFTFHKRRQQTPFVICQQVTERLHELDGDFVFGCFTRASFQRSSTQTSYTYTRHQMHADPESQQSQHPDPCLGSTPVRKSVISITSRRCITRLGYHEASRNSIQHELAALAKVT